MKQIVDKLNKIAKAVDESVTLPNRKLIIDSLDAITDAFGGTKTNSKLIVDKLDDIAKCIHGGVSGEWEEVEITLSITNHIDIPHWVYVGTTGFYEQGDAYSHIEPFCIMSAEVPTTCIVETYIKKGVDNYLTLIVDGCAAEKTAGNIDFIPITTRTYSLEVDDALYQPYLALELYSDLQ